MSKNDLFLHRKIDKDSSQLPLVSIGLPVFNEEQYLSKALEALLNQTYPNIEIIISNNASIDRTEEICKRYQRQHKNILYHLQSVNIGAANNFKKVLSLSCGRYFMWASGHDLWDSNIVFNCVDALENNPSAVIAFGSSVWINELGDPIAKTSGWTDTRGMLPIARFFSIFWGNMHPILGVMRRKCVIRSRILSIAGADFIFLAEMALKGDFIHAVAARWYRREIHQGETFKKRMQRYASEDYGLSKSSIERMFPLWKFPIELLRSVATADISSIEKVSIIVCLILALPSKYITTRLTQL